MNDQDRTAWLRLCSVELPPRRLRSLLDASGFDPARALDTARQPPAAPGSELSPKQVDRLLLAATADVSKMLAALDHLAASIVTLTDSDYPANLKPLADAPPALFVRGQLSSDDKFSVAVVGSRRATSYGKSIAEQFAKELSARGLCIVSGGARGVDTHAHRGALDGGGRTLAFIGCGLDVNYPADNRRIFTEIAESGRGAIVSEFVPGISPEPWRFPARNRLISGSSLGTLVIESPMDSGAIITASEAATQGRDVFAVPGPIGSGRSTGCHKLIQDGAKLVECAEDILDELGILTLTPGPTNQSSTSFRPVPKDLAPEQRKVLEMLTLEARTVDSLIVESGLSAAQLTGMLTLLEMRGLARRVPGNAFVRLL